MEEARLFVRKDREVKAIEKKLQRAKEWEHAGQKCRFTRKCT